MGGTLPGLGGLTGNSRIVGHQNELISVVAVLYLDINTALCQCHRYLAQLTRTFLFQSTNQRARHVTYPEPRRLQYRFRLRPLFNKKMGVRFMTSGKDATAFQANTLAAQRFP